MDTGKGINEDIVRQISKAKRARMDVGVSISCRKFIEIPNLILAQI